MNGSLDAAAPAAAPRGIAILTWTPTVAACILGLMHCVVDTASLAILYSQWDMPRLDWGGFVVMIHMYNGLAFTLQAPMGLVFDRLGAYRTFAALGLAMAAGAIVVPGDWPYLAAVMVAMGNAMFHAGAGGIVLRNSGGRATGPGVFVAPGQVGVTLGLWWGMSGFPNRIVLAAGLAACAALVCVSRFAPPVAAPHPRAARGEGRAPSIALLAALLLLIPIVVRSAAGGAVHAWWPEVTGSFALALTGAVVAGGILGGLLADRADWRVVGVGALAAAGLLATLAPHDPVILGVELALIQMTMPITLTGVYLAMPRWPATAFGLTALAVMIGALPGYVGYWGLAPSAWLLPATLAAAAMILIGLTVLGTRQRPSRVRL
jgi:MFS transporter, FSR family, fosmidomycin resistance protein